MPPKKFFKCKIILVGYPGAGKTSLVRRFVLDEFTDKYLMTVGFKVLSKKLIYRCTDGSEVELTMMIWDIMGQKSYKLEPEKAFLNSKGAILVCDFTRKHTLELLVDVITELFNLTEDIPLVFVANKKDLVDLVKFSEAELAEVATAFNAPHFITSAKTGENVENTFEAIGRAVLQRQGSLN